MKKIFVLITIVVMLLLTSCKNQDTISYEDYRMKYESLMTDLQDHLNTYVLQEAKDMITYETYQVSYSHEDFMHYINQLVSLLDDTIYEFQQIGPKINDVKIQMYQSKLEYALYDLMQILKTVQDKDIFQTMWPSQYTLYDEMYQLNTEMNDYWLKIFNNRYEIERVLQENKCTFAEAFYEDHLKFISSYSYYSNVLAAQVSTYQDYSGLQINPSMPNLLQTSDDSWFAAYEMAYSVMLPQINFNSLLLENYMKYQKDLLGKNDDTFRIFIETYNDTYKEYVSVRALYPYDFYKFGDYKDYQHRVGTIQTRGWYVRDQAVYDFDPIYNDSHHFDIMINAFNILFEMLYQEEHSMMTN